LPEASSTTNKMDAKSAIHHICLGAAAATHNQSTSTQ
jgi:hypothetical protein